MIFVRYCVTARSTRSDLWWWESELELSWPLIKQLPMPSPMFIQGSSFYEYGSSAFSYRRDSWISLGRALQTMPWTTGFCIVGAASISAFPLFSGFVSKSIIITEAAQNGHVLIWLCLLFASAGVFHMPGSRFHFLRFLLMILAGDQGFNQYADCHGDLFFLCIF